MAADLNQLEPNFKATLLEVYAACQAQGHELRPNFTGRTPWQQARFWRQSRTSEELADKLAELKSRGAFWIAEVLQSVGPQHGRWATNALPGMSWHNWKPSKACDSFVVENGVAIWRGDHPGYTALKTEAEARGLTSMAKIGDFGHVQSESREIPEIYDLTTLSVQMSDIWGCTEVGYPVADAASA